MKDSTVVYYHRQPVGHHPGTTARSHGDPPARWLYRTRKFAMPQAYLVPRQMWTKGLRPGEITFADDTGYRKNKATFHAVPPARVRPPPATLRPLVPTPGGGPPAPRCPPGAGLARAGPEAPPPAAGPPWREPAGHRPAPPGTARTAAGPPARLGRRGGDGGAGTAFATAGAHPPCRPRAPARGRPQLTSAQWRPPGAGPALAARRRRLALRGLGDGQAAPLGLRGGGLIQTR
jgi:hypothetical protein